MYPCFDEISSNKTERLQQHNTIQSSLESLAKEAISSSEPSWACPDLAKQLHTWKKFVPTSSESRLDVSWEVSDACTERSRLTLNRIPTNVPSTEVEWSFLATRASRSPPHASLTSLLRAYDFDRSSEHEFRGLATGKTAFSALSGLMILPSLSLCDLM